ncbi:MAG TPA: hypothetical protein PK031_02280 [Pseudomonadales bacterium]|nr:hypothetical protein [Pseudomonadales bacterium]
MSVTDRVIPASLASWEKAACLLLVAGTLLYYWTVFFGQAIDGGQGDDFVDILWFFEIVFSREHWLDVLPVIALPNHEHITIFNHLVYLLDYALFRQVNFFHYMLIGHVVILGCCLLIAEWLKQYVGWWYAIAIAASFFLNLFYWHASFWAMTALSNQAVILFALLSARSAAKYPQAIFAPMLWAVAATLCQFNGLLVLPALAAGNFFAAKKSGNPVNLRQVLVWLFSFVVLAAVYINAENPLARDHLWHFVNYTEPDILSEYLEKSSSNPLEITANSLFGIPLTLFSMSGATVFTLTQWLPASVLGGTLLFCLYRVNLIQREQPDRFWWTVLCFAMASIAIVAAGRGISFGPEAGMAFRYRLYSFLLIVLLAGALLKRKQTRAWLWSMLGAGALIQLCSAHVLDNIQQERDSVKKSHYYWLIDGGMGRSTMPFYPHNQDRRLFNAYERGYYNPYAVIASRHKPVFVSAVKDGTCGLDDTLLESEAGAVKACSKKSRALAVEITLDTLPSVNPVSLLFCGDAIGYRFALDARNIDSDTGKYSPLLVLKKQLPPSQYRVLLQQADSSYKLLGNIAFP